MRDFARNLLSAGGRGIVRSFAGGGSSLADQMDLFAAEDAGHVPGWPVCPFPIPRGLLLGSCAWNHNSFDRQFYPSGLSGAQQLTWYARHFNSVEVDSTFYGVPTAATVDRWAAAVPEDFRFSVKVPRTVTHEGALRIDRDPVAAADWRAFLEVLPRFRGKVSAVLVQLGPKTSVLLFDWLRALVATIPPEFAPVVELRHASWNSPEVTAWLREAKVTRAWVDSYNDADRDVRRDTPELFPDTVRLRYIRLLGDTSTKYNNHSPTKRNFTYGSVLFERDDDLSGWVERARGVLDTGGQVQLAINNHYQGFTPITAALVREALAGR